MDKNIISSFSCDNCGGSVEFDISRQQFRCTSCGAEKIVDAGYDLVKEYDFDDYLRLESQNKIADNTTMVKCGSCGGEVFFGENETANVCPMCGSSHVKVTGHNTGIPPEGVVPFRVDRFEAQKSFSNWIKKRWFAPNLLKKSYADGALSGMYVPFWTYDTKATAVYSGRGGRVHTRKNSKGETQTYVQWYPVSGRVAEDFDDIQVCGSRSSTKNLIEKILPYNTINNCVPFTPNYLAGYKAERYSINAIDGFNTAKQIIDGRLRGLATSDILARGYQQADVSYINTSYHDLTYKHLLLPIWSAQYGYKGKPYHYVINGESGKVSGKYPLSYAKISATAAVILAIIIAIVFYGEVANSPKAPVPQAKAVIELQSLQIEQEQIYYDFEMEWV